MENMNDNSEVDPYLLFGEGRSIVPNSCIEAAEFMIQCISKREILDWTAYTTREPSLDVFAEFGGGRTINISRDEDFHIHLARGLQNYPFNGRLPATLEKNCARK
jgi:hypothetical protein